MKWSALVLLLLLVVPAIATAALDFDSGISPDEEAAFDGILAPVMKIYHCPWEYTLRPG